LAASPVTRSFTVAKASQTIAAFANVPSKTFGDTAFAVTIPAATSGLAVALSVKSGPATVSGNTVTLTGVGTVVLAANQAGNTNFNAAPEITTSFTVDKASQTIAAFANVPSKTFGDAPFTVTLPLATSSLAVVLSVKSGPAAVSGNTVTLTGVGTVVLAANQAGNTNYNAASEVTTSFTVSPPPNPEPALQIEEPVGIDLASNATAKTFGNHLSGTGSSSRFYTMRNTGSGPLTLITLTKLGSHVNDFTIVSPATNTVAAGGSTTFSVSFTPTVGGTRTAGISITSNDTNNSPFIINLSGFGLGEDLDSDGDGLNDAAEFTMSDLGFNWEVAQPSLVNVLYTNANRAKLYSELQYNANRTNGQTDVTSNPSAFLLYTALQYDLRFVEGQNVVLNSPESYNLYTSNSIMDLRMNGAMVPSRNGVARVAIQPSTTTNLMQPFTNNGAPITLEVPMPANRGFLRIQAKPE
jgi:hypothetical protein